MTKTVLMISLKTLKDEYLIDDNLDDKYIIPVITKGQLFIVKPLLGNLKYDKLINDIYNNTTSSDDEILIKDYIQPVIAYYCLSEVVYSTAYKIKNNPDYQNNPSASERFNELIRVSKHYLNDSNHFEQILRDYISSKGIILSSDDVTGKLNNNYKTGLNI